MQENFDKIKKTEVRTGHMNRRDRIKKEVKTRTEAIALQFVCVDMNEYSR